MMAAVRTGDWPRASSLMHPAALKQLRDLLQPILAFAGPEADGIRQQLFGFASMAEAKAASDSTVFVQLMNAVMSQQQGMAEAMATAQFSPIGVIEEGKDTVHVVGRTSATVMKLPFSQVEVISLQRYGATWRGILKGDVVAMATGIRAALEGQK